MIAEVRVLKTSSRRPRWRWDVTWQKPVEGVFAGVYDKRQHQRSDCGYAWTKRGAWRAVRLAYEQGQHELTPARARVGNAGGGSRDGGGST